MQDARMQDARMHQEKEGRKGKIFIFIAALFGALLLWMYAIGYDTEIDERVFSGISVEIEGIGSNGYTVADGESFSMTVDVYASGTRAVLNSLSAGDFKAIVDISAVSEPGMKRLPITIVPPNGVTAANPSVPNVTLYVDAFTSRNVNVQIERTYSSVYEIGETQQSLYTVKVDGPESVIGTAEAYCSFSLGNITEETIFVSGEIRLRDSVTKKDISSSYVTMDRHTVDVTFVLYGNKTVPVVLALTGGMFRPEDVQFLTDDAGVELRGPISELANVSSLSIRCDETQLTDNRLSGTIRAGELLMQNLPESLLIATNADTEISYTVVTPEVLYRTFTVPVSKITIYNLPSGGILQPTVAESVVVRVFGPANAVLAYNASKLSIRVNYLTLEKQMQGADDEYFGTAEIDTGSSAVCVDGAVYTVPVKVTVA